MPITTASTGSCLVVGVNRALDPWVINNKVALIGDAAHAMVPFYGQGMNCGFEDCRELGELIDEHEGKWSDIFPAYQKQRKINADAITRFFMVNVEGLDGKAMFSQIERVSAIARGDIQRRAFWQSDKLVREKGRRA